MRKRKGIKMRKESNNKDELDQIRGERNMIRGEGSK
jgi:hypothetical protein